jgi:hypothetical protein
LKTLQTGKELARGFADKIKAVEADISGLEAELAELSGQK